MTLAIHLLYTALSFFVILSVIVFVHEFGHYIVAKLCGVKVDAFSIGFGKEVVGWNDRSGTRWKISILPLGGYVKMYGDSSEASTPDESINQMTPEQKAVSFHFKPLYKKAMIVAAGPIFNFLLTIGILTYFIASNGLPSTEPVVGEVVKDSPAQKAGLIANDRILSVNGTAVATFNDIPAMIATNVYEPITLRVERDGKVMTKVLTPAPHEDEDMVGNKITRPLIGIKSTKTKMDENIGLPTAVWEATKRTKDICVSTLEVVKQMIQGKRAPDELKGPIGIAKLSGQAADKSLAEGSWWLILWFIAMLSANLGLVNLFPIPLLDGGHLLYYMVEAVRGKPMAMKFQQFGFRVGGALLLCLMAFTILNDIRQLFS